MNTLHPTNHNLHLTYQETWHALPVIHRHVPLIDEYLEKIHAVLTHAIGEYPRTLVVRIDLRFPEVGYQAEDDVMKRFIGSLRSQIEFARLRSNRHGVKTYPCWVRYVWVREQDGSPNPHYHVALMLNRNAYFCLGRLKRVEEYAMLAAGNFNLADRIRKAWASALRLPFEAAAGLVHFPENPVYDLCKGSEDFPTQWERVFERLSYMAKARTKQYGQGYRCFGSSES